MPHLEVDVGRETTKFLAFVRRKLKLGDKDIVPFRDGYVGELVTRAITRAKLFSGRGEEFRDVLLWLTILDVVRETSGETLAFISADAKAFGQNHQLHEPLSLEGQATGKQINFYNFISKFIESHATHVEHITQRWLFMSPPWRYQNRSALHPAPQPANIPTPFPSSLGARGLAATDYGFLLSGTGCRRKVVRR